MRAPLDATHDSALRSWVTAANDPDSDFPIQNLPFGVFRKRGSKRAGTVGVAIGDRILDLVACAKVGALKKSSAGAEFAQDAALNRLMSEGRKVARELRAELVDLLSERNKAAAKRAAKITIARSAAELLLPAAIGNYTDFYASIHHATNVGTMLRPDNPLFPNYKFVPIGYHGRASSIVVSGTPVRRPVGQVKADEHGSPVVGPTRRMDYEAEVAAFVGSGNGLGAPISIDRAGEHLWGLCLLNDWSARDVQAWEYQPLGPFLAKNFATSISPWVVTRDALEPFRVPAFQRPSGDPAPLPYLSSPGDQSGGGFGITIEAWLRSRAMRDKGIPAHRLSRGSLSGMYWTFAQLLTHHTMGGCNLRPGDLLGSGTVTNATKDSRGCLLELTWRGAEPLELPGGEKRGFLEDGDEVTLRAWAEAAGRRRIGFGECAGVVKPAI